jgi:hypothetical protein
MDPKVHYHIHISPQSHAVLVEICVSVIVSHMFRYSEWSLAFSYSLLDPLLAFLLILQMRAVNWSELH